MYTHTYHPLQTMRNFKPMMDSICTVYLVEASKELREQQKKLLCGEDAPMHQSKDGWHSTSKYANIPIVWTETIRGLPRESDDKMPLIVAHEFFDALPIHAFQIVEVPPEEKDSSSSSSSSDSRNVKDDSPPAGPTLQWREMVVSPTPADLTHADLGTPTSLQKQNVPVPEFQMTLSPDSTRHSRYLPESSPRYRALKSTRDALIEVCPDASLYATEFASRIGGRSAEAVAIAASKQSPQQRRQQQQQQQQQPPPATGPRKNPAGAALILDYGPADTIPTNSLRGIRQHARVGPFEEPGLVDLSADVDFAGLAETALAASPGVEVHGPVDQAYFLEAMGIRQRAEMLARKLRERQGSGKKGEGEEEEVKALQAKIGEIERACQRLVDRGPGGMGKLYKVLAIVPENGGRRRPVGFGGDVM